MTYVTGVLSKDVPKTWPTVRRFIASGLVDGTEPERLFDRIMRRECALWIAKTDEKIIAACITECVVKDGRKICNVISIGGFGMDDWLDDLTTIEAWAMSQNCTAMRFEECRAGWAKVLSSRGYRTKLVVLEKAL